MEWIKDYWYIIVLGLVASMFFFGHRTKGIEEEKTQYDKNESHANKNGHSCCH
jgi:hypothetical protein